MEAIRLLHTSIPITRYPNRTMFRQYVVTYITTKITHQAQIYYNVNQLYVRYSLNTNENFDYNFIRCYQTDCATVRLLWLELSPFSESEGCNKFE